MNRACEGVQGHLAVTRIRVIQNSIFPCLPTLHLWAQHALTSSHGQNPPTKGGSEPVGIKKKKKISPTAVTFNRCILEWPRHENDKCFSPWCPPQHLLPFFVSIVVTLRETHEGQAQHSTHSDTTEFPYHCWRLAGALSMLWAGMNWGRIPHQGWCPWSDGRCCCLAMASGS